MTTEELALRLQEVDDRSRRNEGRIKKLESEHDVLHELATSVAVMANQMEALTDNVSALTGKVGELEKRPARRWESLTDRLLWALGAAVVAFLLGRMGL